jgi:hypothetical protein
MVLEGLRAATRGLIAKRSEQSEGGGEAEAAAAVEEAGIDDNVCIFVGLGAFGRRRSRSRQLGMVTRPVEVNGEREARAAAAAGARLCSSIARDE